MTDTSEAALMKHRDYPRHQPYPTRKNSDTCQLYATQAIPHRSPPRPEDSHGVLAAVEDAGIYSMPCSDSSIAAQCPAVSTSDILTWKASAQAGKTIATPSSFGLPKPIYPRFPTQDHKATALQWRRIDKALQKQS